MASIPEINEFPLEGMEDEQASALRPAADVYNTFNEQVSTALNRNLTFSENFRADVRTLSMKPSDKPTFAISIPKPIGLWLINIRNTNNSSHVFSAAPFVDWVWNGRDGIQIKSVAGLSGADTYELTLLVIAG
jgi:hypothetical protein